MEYAGFGVVAAVFVGLLIVATVRACLRFSVWLIPAVGRQVFLICSDGLSREVGDEQLARILSGDTGHAAGLAGELVDAALEHGGRDNVTVIVVESDLGEHDDDDETTRDRLSSRSRANEDTTPRTTGGEHGDLPA